MFWAGNKGGPHNDGGGVAIYDNSKFNNGRGGP